MRKLLIILFLLGGLMPVGAQETTRITYNETVQASISDESYRDLYIFAGRRGEIIAISMRATDGSKLDPYLILLDKDSQILAFDDDGAGRQGAVLDSLRLPYDGDYFLVATRFGHALGNTDGDYELRIERIGATTASGSTIQYGDFIVGQVGAESPQVVYIFEGQRGEVINLQMRRTSGNLDPMIDLANAQGQILLTGDDDPTASGTLNAGLINFTLPYSGFYIVVATRYGRDSGLTQGSFLLSLESIPESQRGLAPANAILIDYASTITGQINSEIPQRFYVFEGQRGDVVQLSMKRTSGNLNPILILLDGQLQELLRADEANQANINAYPLGQTGRYYVMLTRRDFSQGESSGTFEMSLEGRAGLGSDYLELLNNSEVAGFINDVLPFENFLFQGEAGKSINLRMTVTSGDLKPLLTLYLGSKQIAFDNNPNGASILGFRLPETGVYRVEASRISREIGETEGGYKLRLDIR